MRNNGARKPAAQDDTVPDTVPDNLPATVSHVPATNVAIVIDEPVPFATVHMMDKKASDTFDSDILALTNSENTTVDLVNKLVPQALLHVYSGGNVVVANRVLLALKPDRRKQVSLFMVRHLGFEVDDAGLFTSKSNEGKYRARQATFTSWYNNGYPVCTVMVWCATNNRVESKDPDYLKRFESAIKAALGKGGYSSDQLLAKLSAIAAEVHAAEVKASLA